MTRRHLLVGAALAGGLVAAFAGRGSSHRDAPTSASHGSARAPADRLARADVAPPPAPARDAPPAVTPAAAEEDVAPRHLSPEEAIAAAQERIELVRAGLDAALDVEPRDAAWAEQARADVATALSDPRIAGLALARIDCGSTFCRIELASSVDRKSAEDLFPTLIDHEPFRNGGFVDFSDPDGHIPVYVARAGHELPDPSR